MIMTLHSAANAAVATALTKPWPNSSGNEKPPRALGGVLRIGLRRLRFATGLAVGRAQPSSESAMGGGETSGVGHNPLRLLHLPPWRHLCTLSNETQPAQLRDDDPSKVAASASTDTVSTPWTLDLSNTKRSIRRSLLGTPEKTPSEVNLGLRNYRPRP